MQNFYDLSRDHLAQTLTAEHFSSQHATLLFDRVYRSDQADVALAGLPRRLRSFFESFFELRDLKLLRQVKSEDGSIKLVSSLHDKKEIETVIIKEKGRTTLCVSSQVGCAQRCSFCATGRMGLLRNLSAGEIIAQLVLAKHLIRSGGAATAQFPPISNIVFMGMGEPLDNFDAVVSAVRIMTDPFAFSIAPKRVTISTVGHAEGLKKLMHENLKVSLAFSLHHPKSSERSKIVPSNRRFPLDQILQQLKLYSIANKKQIFIQYTMIAGFNDQLSDAEELAKF